MNRYLHFSVALLICAAPVVQAQNINPEVEVTNAYQGKLVESFKQDLPMNVPDSLTRFDYSFDYSVFENPYKGSYEFTPYMINVKPEDRPYTGSKFYLRAGAGYSLHPEAEIAYNNKVGNNFAFSVYDNFSGYFGQYENIQGYQLQTEGYLIDNYNRLGGFFEGHDMQNRVGAAGRYEKNNFAMSFDLAHRLIAASDLIYSHLYQAADLSLKLGSKAPGPKGFTYSASVNAKFGKDFIDYSSSNFSVGDTELKVRADVGKRFGKASGVDVEAILNMASYSNLLNSNVLDLNVLPKYTLSLNRLNLSAGLKLATISGNDFTKGTSGKMHSKKSALFYPDVNVNFRILDSGLDIYGKFTGGNNINAYSSIMEKNHFYNPIVQMMYFKDGGELGAMYPVMDNTVEKFNVFAGFKGQVGQHLGFNLGAGYVSYENLLMDGLVNTTTGNPAVMGYTTVFEDLQMFYVEADIDWKSTHFDAGAHVKFNKPKLGDTKLLSDYFALPSPKFKGEAFLRYNWSNRIYAGVFGEYSSERKGYSVIPQYFNLGVSLEYVFSRRLSFWLRGENLLNQRIQKTLLHAEKGMYATAGICLNL